MNKELAKTLTTALVQFIDREIPEGTMCCSNTDCERLETSFEVLNLAFIEKFIKSKLLGSQTEFEQEVSDIVEYCKEHGENVAFDYAKRHAKSLLSLAKKQLLSFIDSLPEEKPSLTWEDIRRIVNIADALLDDPKARIAIQNHSEEDYYQKVLDEYNKDVLKE